MRRLVLIVAIAALVLGTNAVSAPGATQRRPDLGMARLTDVFLQRVGSQTRLNFSATVVNVGQGDFVLHGQRADVNSTWSVVQRIPSDTGPATEVATPATLVFGGDGHNHWHVKDLEHYELQRLDNGVKVGTSAKSGFCFFDTTTYGLTLPGAPQQAHYSGAGCGGFAALSVDMGLSVGWGDTYSYRLPDQYIDVTGLTAGRYRLIATADPQGQFVEGSEANNTTWVDVQLNGKGPKSAKVVAYGPVA